MGIRIIALLAGALAIAIVATGCGGGDDSGASSSLTKAEFIKQADAICKKGGESVNEEVEDFAEENDFEPNKATKEQQAELLTEVVAANIQSQAEEIDALGAPPGDEAQIEAMLAAVEEGVEKMESEPTLFLSKPTNPLAKGSELAEEYGLEVCGKE